MLQNTQKQEYIEKVINVLTMTKFTKLNGGLKTPNHPVKDMESGKVSEMNDCYISYLYYLLLNLFNFVQTL